MSDTAYDYLEEGKKLIAFAQKVYLLAGTAQRDNNGNDSNNGQSGQVQSPLRNEHQPSGNKIKAKNNTNINNDETQRDVGRKSGFLIKSSTISKNAKQRGNLGNEILRNSDFVKLSDSDDDFYDPREEGESEKDNNHEKKLRSSEYGQSIAKSTDTQIRNHDLHKNNIYNIYQQNGYLNAAGTDNLQKLANLKESDIYSEKEKFSKKRNGKESPLKSSSRQLRSRQKREKQLIESAQKSSEIVFTLLGEPSKLPETELLSCSYSKARTPNINFPPIYPPPLAPPPPPYLAQCKNSVHDHSEGHIYDQNTNFIQDVTFSRGFHNNFNHGEDSNMVNINRNDSTASSITQNSGKSNFLLNSTNSILPTRQGQIISQLPNPDIDNMTYQAKFSQKCIGMDLQRPHVIPNSSNNDLQNVTSPKGRQKTTNKRFKIRENDSQMVRIAKGSGRPINGRKKKIPKSLKRINGMVQKYDLQDN